MKMKKIAIENFKGIGMMQAELGKFNLLVGPNGTGKTAFIEALRFCLTGDLPDNPVRKGEDHARVSILLENGDTLSRVKNSRGTKVQLNGRTVTAKSLDEYLAGLTGVESYGARAASSREVFESMDSGELTSLLLRYVPEELTADKVEEMLPDIPEGCRPTLRSVLPKGSFGLEAVTKAYGSLFEYRAYFRKEAEKYSAKGLPEKPGRTEDEVRKELEEAIKKQGEYEALESAAKKYREAAGKAEEQKKRIGELRRETEGKKAVKPSAAKLKKLEEKWKDAKDSCLQLKVGMAKLASQIENERHTLQSFEGDSCPLCDTITCPMDRDSIRESARKRMEALELELKGKGAELEKAESAAASAEAAVRGWKESQDEYGRMLGLLRTLKTLEDTLVEIPEAPIIDREAVARMKGRAEELNREMKRIHSYAEAEKNAAWGKTAREKYEAYQYLTEAFRPKGILISMCLKVHAARRAPW